MRYDIVRHGREKEAVIIIDDFTQHFHAIVDAVEKAQFRKAAAGYPGIRAPMSAKYLAEKGALLSKIVQEIFGFTKGIKCENCDYSIVTTAPQDLQPAQRIPHYDTPHDNVLAFMHYVADHRDHPAGDKGGTAFYRHRATGFESITPEREAEYSAALIREAEIIGLPKPAYIYGDNERFEMIGEIEARPNRFILYRGRTLHSGCISAAANFSSDPKIGRLTINGFLSDTA